MVPRAKVALLCVYALLTVTGVISLFAPSAAIKSIFIAHYLIHVWGIFFIVGGSTSATALGMRMAKSGALGWWYIEIAGLALLSTSSLIYAAALFELSYTTHALQAAGVGCLVAALSSSLGGRAYEAYRIAKIEKRLYDELQKTARRDGQGR